MIEVLQRLTWNGTPKEIGDLFRVTKNRRKARAVIFSHQFGWELRLEVGELFRTQVCRSPEEIPRHAGILEGRDGGEGLGPVMNQPGPGVAPRESVRNTGDPMPFDESEHERLKEPPRHSNASTRPSMTGPMIGKRTRHTAPSSVSTFMTCTPTSSTSRTNADVARMSATLQRE